MSTRFPFPRAHSNNPRDASGNRVKLAVVSEGTRRDSRNAPEPERPKDSQLDALQSESINLTSELGELNARLARLDGSVRGKRLPKWQYDATVNEQAEIRARIAEVTARKGILNKRIRQVDPNAVALQEMMARMLTAQVETNILLRDILALLRERDDRR
jgi:peptidoglycan hydrolase CwlO-like protein